LMGEKDTSIGFYDIESNLFQQRRFIIQTDCERNVTGLGRLTDG